MNKLIKYLFIIKNIKTQNNLIILKIKLLMVYKFLLIHSKNRKIMSNYSKIMLKMFKNLIITYTILFNKMKNHTYYIIELFVFLY
jgi:hypothetical protein